MTTASSKVQQTGFIFTTDPSATMQSITTRLGAETVPCVVFDASNWSDTSKMAEAFSREFPNQDTDFLIHKFSETGQVVIVNNITNDALDSITFLVITLSHLFVPETQVTPSDSLKAIVLLGWPYPFVGMANENGTEVRFQVEQLP